LSAHFISVTALNVHIVADDGKIINWGRNTYGQLGCHENQRSDSWKPQMMDNIEDVVQLAVGSEHNIAVLGTFELTFYFFCGTGLNVL
jgi:alpha-tubulin suppressor-like RCC1 family protein